MSTTTFSSPIPRRLRTERTGTASKLTLFTIPLLAIALLFGLMMPGPSGSSGRDFNYRIPPYWSPENEHQYSFRAYMTDISLWVMLTDLHPHQQCAAIIMRLGGAAKEMARMITPSEILNGGAGQQGQPLDPVSYLLSRLYARFCT